MLATGVTLGLAVLVLSHPVAVATCLILAILLARATGALHAAPLLRKAALGLGVSVLLFNGLFSWNGATVLWEAPFRITLLGRPRFTLEALAWGGLAGLQLATTVLALGAATLTVPPETLHRGLSRIGLPAGLARAAGLALRTVPDTRRDAQAMGKAMRARGLATDGLRASSQLLVPLTARALDRSLVAEEALLLRGGGAGGRTAGGLPAAALVGLVGLAAAATVAIWGPGRPAYYPTVSIALDPVSLGLLGLALVVPAWLTWGVLASSR